MQRRILVYLQRESDKYVPRVANFTQSVVNAFNDDGLDTNKVQVFVKLQENRLILSENKFKSDDQAQESRVLLSLMRPSFCPIHNLTPSLIDQLYPDTKERGIDCGCAVILESSDGNVLLIRRAQHLRTFPGVWTPPGGHIEENEMIIEAGLRELKEETGLTIEKENCVNEEIKMLALWESTYPAMLSFGLPIRHHIVIYLHAKLKQPFTTMHLQSQLKLDPKEVGASTWITKDVVKAIVKTFDVIDFSQDEHDASNSILPPTITITTSHQKTESITTRILLSQAPESGQDVERVSTGTKFALNEWLKTYL